MKIEQIIYQNGQLSAPAQLEGSAQWVLVFGARTLLGNKNIYNQIRKMYPGAYLMGCSTAGEIMGSVVYDDTICITAIAFEKAKILFSSYPLDGAQDNDYYDVGRKIVAEINQYDLKHLFVLSEGININGSKLVQGMRSEIDPKQITITGGLAGDGAAFGHTVIMNNEFAKKNQIVVAALYGDIHVGCASVGGWDTFGIERIVTKSRDNILYEMDGKPALDLYKEYLGDLAEKLPASALLFPLSVRPQDGSESYVRTILSVDEEQKSLVFAGDIPINAYCKLMKANSDNLIGGATEAVALSIEMIGQHQPELGILISCVGRKLVLKQRVDEEIEAIQELIPEMMITGFYSYGEIAPHKKDTNCDLHNQTMTITFLSEV